MTNCSIIYYEQSQERLLLQEANIVSTIFISKGSNME